MIAVLSPYPQLNKHYLLHKVPLPISVRIEERKQNLLHGVQCSSVSASSSSDDDQIIIERSSIACRRRRFRFYYYEFGNGKRSAVSGSCRFGVEKPNASRRSPQRRRFFGATFDELIGRLGVVRDACEKERERADCIVRERERERSRE